MSGDSEGKLWFWDWKNMRNYRTIKAHDGVCFDAVWHPMQQSRVRLEMTAPHVGIIQGGGCFQDLCFGPLVLISLLLCLGACHRTRFFPKHYKCEDIVQDHYAKA